MIACSVLVITRKYSDYAVFGLLAVVVTQALGYGLIFDLNFFLRNLSVMGGLLMVLSDSWVRKKFAPAGLPSIDEKDRKMYFQLAGRVLLIFLFIGFVFAGDWGVGRVLVSLFGFVACVMVVVGFKAKWSAVILVVILSIFNLLVNNFWTVRFPLCFIYLVRIWVNTLIHEIPAPRTSPAQGLCQIRLFPNLVHRVRSFSHLFPVSLFSSHSKLTPHSTAAVSSSSSTWAPANSALMRRKKSTKYPRPDIQMSQLGISRTYVIYPRYFHSSSLAPAG